MSRQSGTEFGLMSAAIGDSSYANPEVITELATRSEAAGFDLLTMGEHVGLPLDLTDEYPYHPEGKPPFESTDNIYEVFGVMSYLAGVTDEIMVGTNICIPPFRKPLLLARQIGTLADFSDGRFDFGVGLGWSSDEYDLVDVPFEERGSRLDEFLSYYDEVKTEGTFAFEGDHHTYPEMGVYPGPDVDHPRLWIGGHTGAAIRRVAEFGDGWTTVWEHPDEVAEFRERLMNAWTDYDRDGEPEIAVIRPVHVGTDTDRDTDRLFVGEPAEIIEDIEAYQEVGTTRIIMDFFTRDSDEQLEQLERFGDDVLPHV